MRTIATIIILITTILSCIVLYRYCEVQKSKFSFFVAGHVYGGVGADNSGVHPPFREFLISMGKDVKYDFGVYAGDIVKDATEKDWNEVDNEIKEFFGKPVYFAPGNHDMVDSVLYVSRYNSTYKFFEYKRNRFIFLDGNLDHWNISAKQLAFLEKSIENIENVDNIFIFSHQVLWWTWENKYKELKLNSHHGYKAFPNYWEEVHPRLDSLNKPVYVFAGDVGAAKWASNYMYDKVGNVHLLVTGMGVMEQVLYLIHLLSIIEVLCNAF